MAVVWNIPIACNRASADFMISSPLMDGEYDRLVPDYESYRNRKLAVDKETVYGAGDSGEVTFYVTGDSGEGTVQGAGDSGEETDQSVERSLAMKQTKARKTTHTDYSQAFIRVGSRQMIDFGSWIGRKRR